jgi:hypothetical protein
METNFPDRYYDPSPGHWAFHDHIYGLRHTLLDRDGWVLTTNVRRGDGAVMAVTPAIARRRPREPGEDDE